MTGKILFFIVLVFILEGNANADLYTWEDERGSVHITDYPPPPKAGKKIQVYKSGFDSAATVGVEDAQSKVKEEKKEADIILFTKNECDDCDKARNFLTGKKAPFTEYNIDKSREAARKRKEADDSTDSPYAIIYRNQIYGFSEAVYNKALRLKP